MDHATFVSTRSRDERAGRPLTRYEDDAHAWAMEQAELLRAGRFAELDLVNLADEVADVGHREYDKMESDLARVIQHLLKWDSQPERRSRSWVNTIKEHRRRVDRQLDNHPSLKGRRTEALREAFKRGRAEALIETDLPDDRMPEPDAPSWDDVMSRPIAWPEL